LDRYIAAGAPGSIKMKPVVMKCVVGNKARYRRIAVSTEFAKTYKDRGAV
jgi:hypothetical protein